MGRYVIVSAFSFGIGGKILLKSTANASPLDLNALIAKAINEALSRWLPNLATKQEVQTIVESAITNRPPVAETNKIRLDAEGHLIIPAPLIASLQPSVN